MKNYDGKMIQLAKENHVFGCLSSYGSTLTLKPICLMGRKAKTFCGSMMGTDWVVIGKASTIFDCRDDLSEADGVLSSCGATFVAMCSVI